VTVNQLETAAIRTHRAGDTWSAFWARYAADVARAEPDYCARGELIHRLVGIVAAGNLDGERPAGDLLDVDSTAPVVPIVSDTATRARCLWSPG